MEGSCLSEKVCDDVTTCRMRQGKGGRGCAAPDCEGVMTSEVECCRLQRTTGDQISKTGQKYCRSILKQPLSGSSNNGNGHLQLSVQKQMRVTSEILADDNSAVCYC
jgi:hypothetical protein